MSLSVVDFLKECSQIERFSGGRDFATVSQDDIRHAAERFNLPLRHVEIAALLENLIPRRYVENIPVLGREGQVKLLRSTVAVVGAGGSGGYVCELLARAGVGHLIIIDPDHFDETNLNRQLLSTEVDIGKPKAAVASSRIAKVNSAVEVRYVIERATEETVLPLIEGATVLVDCVNTDGARIALQMACKRLKIPMVHGTIGGYIGRVMTIMPGDIGVLAFYDNLKKTTRPNSCKEEAKEADYFLSLGSPTVTPAAIAPWQVAETIKIITGKGEILRNRVLVIDMLSGSAAVIPLGAVRLGKLIRRIFRPTHGDMRVPK
ncbi:MAG TPA: HesA/MoeB/ThiF family protein [Clostridia bacterium]|nr:HesA/MoeB/ThiF family protein [Clostridia bacterium]